MSATDTVLNIAAGLRRDLELLISLRGVGSSMNSGRTTMIISEVAGRWQEFSDEDLVSVVTNNPKQQAYAVERLIDGLIRNVGASLGELAHSVGGLQARYPKANIPTLAKRSNKDVIDARTFSGGVILREMMPNLEAAFENIGNVPREKASYTNTTLRMMNKFVGYADVIRRELDLNHELIGNEDVIGHTFTMNEIEMADSTMFSTVNANIIAGVGNALTGNAAPDNTRADIHGNGVWLVTSGDVPAALINLTVGYEGSGLYMFRVDSLPFDYEAVAPLPLVKAFAQSDLEVAAPTINGVTPQVTNRFTGHYLVRIDAPGPVDFELENIQARSQYKVTCMWVRPTDISTLIKLGGINTGVEIKSLLGRGVLYNIMPLVTRSRKWGIAVELSGYMQRFATDLNTLQGALQDYYDRIRDDGEPGALDDNAVNFEWYFDAQPAYRLSTLRKLYSVWHSWMVTSAAALASSPEVADEYDKQF
jgi:hypothetical protein